MTRLLHVSDLHYTHRWYEYLATRDDVDGIIMAGDLLDGFSSVSLHTQVRHVRGLLSKTRAPLFVCSGNHCVWPENRSVAVDVFADGNWVKMLRSLPNVVAVDGDCVEFRGLKLQVNGWLKVPPEKDDVSVLITHAAPAGSDCAIGSENLDVGDPHVWDAIRYAVPPVRVVCAGHVHRPRRTWCRWDPVNESTLVLVPGFDEQAATPNWWMLDFDCGYATHSGGVRVKFC